ncbi:MAG: aldo/keto reductase [Bacteroidota bacterium]
MKTRRFGRTNWPVSEIGYGMWGMAGWTGSEDAQSMQSMQHAVDLGCTFFDTAWGYGEGHSEKLLGRLVRANPSVKLYTATKLPPKNFAWPSQRSHTLDDCFPPDHIKRYAESSLENSGLSRFDVIQFHTWEDHWLDDHRLARSIDMLKAEGYCDAVGISINRWEPWNGIRTVRSGLIDVVQGIYNIFDQNPEDELLPACEAMDVAFIARVPFDEGTLTGRLTAETTWPEGDWRNTYFVPENLSASVARADALKPLATEAGLALPEMALRFILSTPAISTTIPGMRKLPHVAQNLATSEAGPLSPTLLAKLKSHRWDRTPTGWSQ